ncbi:MAG: Dam family site-specific DNA-(adenine-N6)-methyltransferase [Colwellia sp.]|nr:Dam family site-specific DNA-(adenine-N6)-methyltransferase [Colwellia sp.]MCW8865135.1 Dam family site-specific DNA-(adenine-N6)-methyltransferase [Colwellia sp.]MCW9081982.1 Dam family site-specific DNA-(adenine-N6)-methyltransferase [Colwellia sp.]
MRSALKWAGGKKKVVSEIASLLPIKGKKRLVEPFVGGGSVFLNLDFDEYLLVDMNKDLIALFNIIKNQPTAFISDAEKYFNGDHNQPEKYYEIRSQFNQSTDPYERSLLFLYLNRHGYNGLCRYNKSGGYNVPFGRYKHPYFPKDELKSFSEKAQKATFIQGDFETAFSQLKADDVVYCDPPYSPINPTSNFTAYAGNSFTDEDQQRLVACAEIAKSKNIPTLISNHYVDFTKKLYKDATEQKFFQVRRTISQKGKGRIKVEEVLALYK